MLFLCLILKVVELMHNIKQNDILTLSKRKKNKKSELVSKLDPPPLVGSDSKNGSGLSYRNYVWN